MKIVPLDLATEDELQQYEEACQVSWYSHAEEYADVRIGIVAGEVVGWTITACCTKLGFCIPTIIEVYVQQEHRRHGYGRELLEDWYRWVKSLPKTMIGVHAIEEWAAEILGQLGGWNFESFAADFPDEFADSHVPSKHKTFDPDPDEDHDETSNTS